MNGNGERQDGAAGPVRPRRPGPVRPRRPHDFDAIYQDKPGWDIDRPQRALLTLANTGGLRGSVLDVGCGTGEHALMAASAGFEAVGIDMAAAAITIAERKARERGLAVRFLVANALEVDRLGQNFHTVLDSGLFHVLDDADRSAFVESLASAIPAGGHYYLLCFSDQQPGDWGPRRVTREEILAAFDSGWKVESIEPTTIDITINPEGARAWLATITRTR